jgi:hypothetical protein
MTDFAARIKRIEDRAAQVRRARLVQLVNSVAALGPECLRLWSMYVARELLERQQDSRVAEGLRENETWLREREAAEPGFTAEVTAKLIEAGLLVA